MRYHHRLVAVLQVSCIDLVGNFPEKLLSSEMRINIMHYMSVLYKPNLLIAVLHMVISNTFFISTIQRYSYA